MKASDQPASEGRCTYRKHVIENGSTFCDCKTVMVGPTVAKNATVVTILHSSMAQEFLQDTSEGGEDLG